MNEEIIIDAIKVTISSFDFSFCICSNLLTYFLIKMVDEMNGRKYVSTWIKRIILICSITIMSFIYYYIGVDLKLLTNSAILTPVFWSWVIKPLCKIINIDYKSIK